MRKIAEVNYQNVSKLINKANPLLAKAIETIPTKEQPPLILVTYEYGDPVIKNSTIYLPDETGRLLAINELKKNHFAKKLLSYSQIPIGIVINKSCEVYVEHPQQVIPLNCIKAGSAFGLFESLAQKQTLPSAWSVTSGSRSLFMLPSISDLKHHLELQRQLNLTSSAPKLLKDQFFTFKEIAEKANAKWQCQVLFLTQDWLKQSSSSWLLFRNFLLELAWSQSHYLRNEHNQSFLWERLMAAIADARIKPSPYQLETVKHLTAIHSGSYPGYAPSLMSTELAPIKLLQDVYVDIYGLGQAPIFMVPKLWRQNTKNKSPLYYSLAYPTVLLGNHLKSPRGFIQEIHAIKQIITLYEQVLLQYIHDHQQANFSIMKLHYFHPQESATIHSFNQLTLHDECFMRSAERFKHLPFPAHSIFGRGCIQILSK
jgi:hypothetical protein